MVKETSTKIRYKCEICNKDFTYEHQALDCEKSISYKEYLRWGSISQSDWKVGDIVLISKYREIMNAKETRVLLGKITLTKNYEHKILPIIVDLSKNNIISDLEFDLDMILVLPIPSLIELSNSLEQITKLLVADSI